LSSSEDYRNKDNAQSSTSSRGVFHVSVDLVRNGRSRLWCTLPEVIEVSAFHMLLLTETGWLDRRERGVLAKGWATN